MVLGLAIGVGRLSDNSFFTHLATGRLIVDSWHIPRSDPYTFTAPGAEWVVQSWLPSMVYGIVDDLVGGAGLRLLMGGFTALLAGLAWRLTYAAHGVLVRVGIVGLAVAIGSDQWSSRPLLVGLVAFAVTILASDNRASHWWLIPLGWIWLNSHGSFPLGVVYLACAIVGRRVDGDPTGVEVRALRSLVAGILLGAINPLGPRLLVFPVELLQRQEVLEVVREWQAPNFQSFGERLFLVQVVLCILALARRPSYRQGVVVAVFLAAALLGSRNIGVASLAFLPVIAAAWPEAGSLRIDARPGVLRLGLPLLGALVLIVGLTATRGPHYNVDAYPIAHLRFLEAQGIDLTEARLGGPELVGNLQELLGVRGTVFFDDRFDMFPDRVNRDLRLLHRGGEGAREALDSWNLDLLIWRIDAALSEVLIVDPDWRILRSDDEWHLFCRSGSELGPTLSC